MDRRVVTLVPWVARLAWVAVAVLGADAAEGWGRPVAVIGAVVWLAGVAALAVPSPVSLTATRVLVPLSIPVAVAAATDADPGRAIGLIAAAVVATAATMSAELGQAFVGASAYGDEERFPLRPAMGAAIAAVVLWLLWAATLGGAAIALGRDRWWAGGALLIVAAAFGWWSFGRWHQLSRRWLVLVPAGIVVHDPLVLAETLMLSRPRVRGIALAAEGTRAADLTGPASGHAIEITTHTAETAVVVRGTTATPIHLTAALIAPSRPGLALAAVRRRGYHSGG